VIMFDVREGLTTGEERSKDIDFQVERLCGNRVSVHACLRASHAGLRAYLKTDLGAVA